VVGACRRDLERAARDSLPADLAQIDLMPWRSAVVG
jgi:hypothetical protein